MDNIWKVKELSTKQRINKFVKDFSWTEILHKNSYFNSSKNIQEFCWKNFEPFNIKKQLLDNFSLEDIKKLNNIFENPNNIWEYWKEYSIIYNKENKNDKEYNHSIEISNKGWEVYATYVKSSFDWIDMYYNLLSPTIVFDDKEN